jgi:AcrR family transcriptional regulator
LIQQKKTTQDELLRSALQLFANKGYFNTSFTEIAQHAQLSHCQEIYLYFDNKQQLAATLYNHILDSLSVSLDDIRRRHQKAAEQLRALVDLLFKLAEDAPDVLRFLLNSNTSEFLPDEKSFLQSPAVNKMLKIIQLGINNGEIRSLSPMLIYSYFFGIINTTLTLILNGTLDKKTDLYQSQAWLAAWNAIAKK